jgi:hypothetical protein
LAKSINIGLNMNQIDREIIAEPQKDGRLNNQESSEKVALSPSPCLPRDQLTLQKLNCWIHTLGNSRTKDSDEATGRRDAF